MEKRDLYSLFSMVGGFIAYWIFCLVIIAQYSAGH